MKVKFKETLFPIRNEPNVAPTHLQVSIEPEGISLDTVLTEAKESTEITLYNDEDIVTGIYTGYEFFTITCIENEDPVISVEFTNTDIVSQINELQNQVENLQSQLTEAEGTLTLTASNVSALPITVYDDRITSDMIALTVTLSNPEAYISEQSIEIAAESVTISGTISDTSDITLYLVHSY